MGDFCKLMDKPLLPNVLMFIINRSQNDNLPIIDAESFISEKYNMSHMNRGVAVIINNKTFDKKTGLKERAGTDVDANKMEELFNTMEFERLYHQNDLKAHDMKKLMNKGGDNSYSNTLLKFMNVIMISFNIIIMVVILLFIEIFPLIL